MFLILHNIRSIYNVGAIFRTAEAVGARKIYLSGYTPTPLDRFGRLRRDFHKSALGAEKLVLWEYYKSPGKLIDKLKKEGTKIIALEQDKSSTDYKNVKHLVFKKTALMLGNEVRGLSRSLLDKADRIIEIPMRGKKESLNVSVALGIALYELIREDI